MTINQKKRRIEMTEAEAKAASKYNSDEYNELVSIRRDFPNYSMFTVKSKNKRTDTLKGLTFNYMEAYIEKHGTEEQADSFKALRGADDGLGHFSPSYGTVKKWFLEQFPEILEYNKKIDRILHGKEVA